MPDDHDPVALLVTASGVFAVLLPAALQVMWLLGLAVVVIHQQRRRRPAPGFHPE